jgi:hypothetical protein
MLPKIPSDDPENTWMSRKAAAIYLTRIGCPIGHRTLDSLAANGNRGKGPPFTRVGHKYVRYRESDLIKWAAARSEYVP